MFARRKDGSLNLSIQAIVILVMAMAVLGLGLGFIRTLMGQGQDQLGRAIGNADLENPADAANPITVDKRVNIEAGKSEEISVGVYNNGFASADVTPLLVGGATCPADTITLSAAEQNIPQGDSKGYVVIVSATSSATGTYICTIAADSLSKQFIVQVNS